MKMSRILVHGGFEYFLSFSSLNLGKDVSKFDVHIFVQRWVAKNHQADELKVIWETESTVR